MKHNPLQAESFVTLKPLEGAHASALFLLTDSNRAQLREWLPWLDHTKLESDSLGFIRATQAEAEKGASYVYGIWFKGELCGVVSLQSINKANRSVAIGYWVGKEFAGNSLARKASAALVRHAFMELGFNRVEIRCATENIRSQRIPEALGFHYEGTLRESEWLYDHFVDHRVYSILRSEYQVPINPP